VRLEDLGQLNQKSNDSGNRTRDLTACSTVPKPTTLPCVPLLRNILVEHLKSSCADKNDFNKRAAIFCVLRLPTSLLLRHIKFPPPSGLGDDSDATKLIHTLYYRSRVDHTYSWADGVFYTCLNRDGYESKMALFPSRNGQDRLHPSRLGSLIITATKIYMTLNYFDIIFKFGLTLLRRLQFMCGIYLLTVLKLYRISLL
jgi:hypothetical protein